MKQKGYSRTQQFRESEGRYLFLKVKCRVMKTTPDLQPLLGKDAILRQHKPTGKKKKKSTRPILAQMSNKEKEQAGSRSKEGTGNVK